MRITEPRRVLSFISGVPWAIESGKAQEIIDILNLRISRAARSAMKRCKTSLRGAMTTSSRPGEASRCSRSLGCSLLAWTQ